jgi:hypothetical protein
MRLRAQRSSMFRADDTVRFALLIVGAWAAGIAIVLLLGTAQPSKPAAHAVDASSPSTEVTRQVAGRRWTSTPLAVVELAGRRWTSTPLAVVELAGRRWQAARADDLEMTGLRSI